MKTLQTLVLLAWWSAWAMSALAADEAIAPQPPTAVQEFAPVLVQGMGNPATTRYANLLRGVQAFHDNHAMAPTADLKFRVTELAPSSAPLKLRLETDETVIPIEVDSDGFFVLPNAAAVGALDGELVANRQAGTVYIGPVIRSEGFDDKRFRLGDNRLWCEVVSAIKWDEIPLLLRLKVAISSPICKNEKIKIFHMQRHGTVLSGKLVEGKSEMDVQIKDNGFSVPLHDMAWTHDAIVQLQVADSKSAPKEHSR